MKAITIWIDEKEHKEAQRKAKGEDRSLSWLVRKLLRDFNASDGK